MDPTAGADVTYRFRVVPSHPIPQYSYLVVELPDEVRVADEGEMMAECIDYDVYGFSEDYILCDYDDEENTVRIENGFENIYE